MSFIHYNGFCEVPLLFNPYVLGEGRRNRVTSWSPWTVPKVRAGWLDRSFWKWKNNFIHIFTQLGIYWSGWKVPIRGEILITKGMVWPGSSDKWKVQDDSKSEVVSKTSLAWVTFLGQRTLLAWQNKNVSFKLQHRSC